MLWWGPFGGLPEEDVFPRFGMNASQLADRFAYIVAALNTCTDRLDPADIDLLARARCHPKSVRCATSCPSFIFVTLTEMERW
jgi:hypothetical protein